MNDVPTNRRSFLQFLGRASVSVTAGGLLLSHSACESSQAPPPMPPTAPFPIKGMAHSTADDLILSDGLTYDVLLRWDDAISEVDRFGFNNDYIAFIPLSEKDPTDGMLWVNHEYLHELFVSGFVGKDLSQKTKEQVEKEMYSVGGSLVRIQQKEGKWTPVLDDARNRRLTAQTVIPFDWEEPIMGSTTAVGTFANCSGGVTPWGTILTCEENYDMFYGESDYNTIKDGVPQRIRSSYDYGWADHYDYPPEHYGWVVEVNPTTGEAKKLVALGRCAHECATVHQTPDGRLVVYSGDDHNDECLYKFISDAPNNLRNGKLYVADTEKGQWLSLVYDEQPALQEHFKNQTEVLIRLREAAKLVGGTPLNRPEDIEIDPLTGDVLIALTNNKPKGDYLGQILKIKESDPTTKTSLTFEASTYLAGGEETGFACPDNMAFDQAGNLWFTSDISGSSMNQGVYTPFGNNGLFVVPSWGTNKGKVLQVASAPVDAELTGPFFAPDGKTLFLSVQHPGERSPSLEKLTSHWPNGAGTMPKPAVVCISGPALLDLAQPIG